MVMYACVCADGTIVNNHI